MTWGDNITSNSTFSIKVREIIGCKIGRNPHNCHGRMSKISSDKSVCSNCAWAVENVKTVYER